jgi:hypothetical protein
LVSSLPCESIREVLDILEQPDNEQLHTVEVLPPRLP